MANDIFNFRRFGKYLSSDLRACLSNFGITLGVAIAVPAILYFFYGIFALIFTGNWASSPMAARLVFFGLVILVLIVAMPSVCYGKVTDKRSGSQFLMIPVSYVEKTLSMVLVCCIIFPAVFLTGYLALDGLLCLCDKGCGGALLSSVNFFKDMIAAESDIPLEYKGSFMALANPFMYLDDHIFLVLSFLLGALWFKKGKISKTILAFILWSFLMSLITAPIGMSVTRSIAASGDPYVIFDRFSWIFRHIGLVDTISDTVGNIVLLALIFLRVKTLKH